MRHLIKYTMLKRIFKEQGFKVDVFNKYVYQVKYIDSETEKYHITLDLTNKRYPELGVFVKDFSYIEKAFESLVKTYKLAFENRFNLVKAEKFVLSKKETTYDKKTNCISYYTEWIRYYPIGGPCFPKDLYIMKVSPYGLEVKLYDSIDFLHKAKLFTRAINILRFKRLPNLKIEEDYKKSKIAIRYKPDKKIEDSYFFPNIKKFIKNDLRFYRFFNTKKSITIRMGERKYIRFSKRGQIIKIYFGYISSVSDILSFRKLLYKIFEIKFKNKYYDKSSLALVNSSLSNYSEEFRIQNLVSCINLLWMEKDNEDIVRLEAKNYDHKHNLYKVSLEASCVTDFEYFIKFSLKALGIFSKSLPHIEHFVISKDYSKGILNVYSNKAEWQKEIEELPNIKSFIVKSFYDIIKNKE